MLWAVRGELICGGGLEARFVLLYSLVCSLQSSVLTQQQAQVCPGRNFDRKLVAGTKKCKKINKKYLEN